MSKQRLPKTGQCVYCGSTKPLTRDHIIPKSLFSRPFPANLMTVPACFECNNRKSRDDEYLRDVLTLDLFGNQHPIASHIFSTKVLAAQRRNSSEVVRTVLLHHRPEALYTRMGVYLGDAVSAPIDEARMIGIFTRIVRGLYYDARRQRIPDQYVFDLRRYHLWEFDNVWSLFSRLHVHGPKSLGSIFSAAYVYAQEDAFSTWWLLLFYERVLVSVSTYHPDAPYDSARARASTSSPRQTASP